MPDYCDKTLLLQWVKEKWDFARERSLKSAPAFGKAYKALDACPMEFQHPSQLKTLRGFGPVLCEELTKRLQEHCEANGIPMPTKVPLKKKVHDGLNALDGEAQDEELAPKETKKPRAKKPYVPAYRSGAYAILLTLAKLDEDSNMGMSKADLIEMAQPHCDASFTAPTDATKFYTAWASMKTLQTKEYVVERGRPTRRYQLTDDGWEVALRVKEIAQKQTTGSRGASARQGSVPAPVSIARPAQGRTGDRWFSPDPGEDEGLFVADGPALRPPLSDFHQQDFGPDFSNLVPGSQDKVDTAIPRFTPIRLEPGTFEVHLVLDNREVRTRRDRDYMSEELIKKGIKPIVRSLGLGDVQWVAKCKDETFLNQRGCEGDPKDGGAEIVLDYILERKRLDDLISSIKDGRFHEQKFRLRQSAMQNVIYAVEEITISDEHHQKYEESVSSALASLQVVSGFFLKQTRNMDETIRYLVRMTRELKDMFEKRTLSVIPTPVLTAGNYLPVMKHLRETQAADSWHITYPAFASLASKSQMMTLRDVYLKMLMCTKGVTGEKAIEIQKRWKTPNNLVKAFEACGDGEAGKKRKRELVAKELSYLVARKKINTGVSKTIAEVWGGA